MALSWLLVSHENDVGMERRAAAPGEPGSSDSEGIATAFTCFRDDLGRAVVRFGSIPVVAATITLQLLWVEPGFSRADPLPRCVVRQHHLLAEVDDAHDEIADG